MESVEPLTGPGPARIALLAAWIAVRLLLVFYLGQQGVLFFYQAF